jgi:hypothetical protein
MQNPEYPSLSGWGYARSRAGPVPVVHGAPPKRVGCKAQTSLGMLPLSVRTMRMSLCPRSAVGSNMHGQPPSITVMPRSRPYSVAASETLPAPGPRCVQTCLIPSSAHSRIVSSAISGRVVLDVSEGVVRTIHLVANPEKLAGVRGFETP